MSEIEIKIFDVDKKTLTNKLIALKAKKEYEGLFRVVYFDFKDKRIQKAHEVLRLRQSKGKKAELVCKYNRRVINEMKVCEELKVDCDNLKNMEKIFLKLGLKRTQYYEKKRESYIIKIPNSKFKILLEFDEYPNGFSYLEIEADSSKKVSKAITLLGLENHEKSNETVDEVFDRKFGKGSLDGLIFKK